MMSKLDPTLYRIAWIAPLLIEARAAICSFDKLHDGQFPLDRGDDNVYIAGEIGGHHAIIATLPTGQEYGNGSAAALASQIKKFFPNLWFGLLVGVAAGLPNFSIFPPRDIRLGDVLVGLPEGDHAGLIAYDLGRETDNEGLKLLQDGRVLAPTEPVIRSAIGKIRLFAPDGIATFLQHYEAIRQKKHEAGDFNDPGQDKDHFYQTDADGFEHLVTRDVRPSSARTRVWYGAIGSGEKVMKNARKRNELRDKHNIIGLEMEAAGTMNRIPVGVIRGVCDYGDRHKANEWQPYAAAMAAAYAKAILYEIGSKPNEAESVMRQQGQFDFPSSLH